MNKRTKIFKIILLIAVIAIMIGVTIYLIPLISELNTAEGQEAFKDKISSSGFLGILMLF